MRSTSFRRLLICVVAYVATQAVAAVPPAPKLPADAYFLMDAATGQVDRAGAHAQCAATTREIHPATVGERNPCGTDRDTTIPEQGLAGATDIDIA